MTEKLKAVSKIAAWIVLGVALSYAVPDFLWLHQFRQDVMANALAEAKIRQAVAQQQTAPPPSQPVKPPDAK